jgi:hypothetical protein
LNPTKVGNNFEGERKMKNKLEDLSNHLYAELERLGDESLTSEQLIMEAGRARSICMVAEQIISTGRLVMDAVEIASIPGAENQLSMLLGEKKSGLPSQSPGNKMALIS